MTFVKAHAVWFGTVAAAVVSFLTPSVNTYVATHPQYAVAIAGVWGTLAALAKSPRS